MPSPPLEDVVAADPVVDDVTGPELDTELELESELSSSRSRLEEASSGSSRVVEKLRDR